MKRRLLKKGDRIRLTVRLVSGWKGNGTVRLDQRHHDDMVSFYKDGDDLLIGYAAATQLALLRNQSPPVGAT